MAPKLTLEDGRVDWSAPAVVIDSLIRGVTPEPGAFTELDDARLKIHEATIARDAAPLGPGEVALVERRVLVGTGSVPIELIRVQPAGKTAMAAADWWRGRPSATARLA